MKNSKVEKPLARVSLPPNHHQNNLPVDLSRLSICLKKNKWRKRKQAEVLHARVSQFMWKLGLNTLSSGWLGFRVVSALPSLHASSEHTPFRLWNDVQGADFTINAVLFAVSLLIPPQ